jgi:nitrate reductase gamma subunit
MAQGPLGFQAPGLLAMLLFTFWPFTRLVHVVQRTDRLPGGLTPSTAAASRGWERIGSGFPAITTIML